MAADFCDDLYGSSPALVAKYGGCGLKAFCGGAAFNYTRHGEDCRPGLWLVGVHMKNSSDMLDEFYPLLMTQAHAVVDDFGNLRRVQ